MRRSTQDLQEQLDSGFTVYLIDHSLEKIVVYKISLINSDFPRTFINRINEECVIVWKPSKCISLLLFREQV